MDLARAYLFTAGPGKVKDDGHGNAEKGDSLGEVETLVLKTIRKIYKLYNTVQTFVDEYLHYIQERTLWQRPTLCRPGSQVFHKPQSEQDFLRRTLSKFELIKLRRGFLQYELVCRLFRFPYLHNFVLHHDDGNKIEEALVDELTTEQAEEIRCIAAFVDGQYKLMLAEIRENFDANVILMESTVKAPRTTLPQDLWDFESLISPRDGPTCLMSRIFQRLGTDKDIVFPHLMMNLYDEEEDFPMHVFYHTASSLGLSFLKYLLSQSPLDRQTWIRRLLTVTLKHTEGRYSDQLPGENFPLLNDFDCEHIHRRSFEHLNLAKYLPENLRQIGWVFWDDSRLTGGQPGTPAIFDPPWINDKTAEYELAPMGSAIFERHIEASDFEKLVNEFGLVEFLDVDAFFVKVLNIAKAGIDETHGENHYPYM